MAGEGEFSQRCFKIDGPQRCQIQIRYSKDQRVLQQQGALSFEGPICDFPAAFFKGKEIRLKSDYCGLYERPGENLG